MDFSADIDRLEDVIAVYERSLKLLKENLKMLNRSLKTIDNDGWSGLSKDKFMSVRYGNFEKGIREHISRLEFLNKMLKEARSEFVNLEWKGNNL